MPMKNMLVSFTKMSWRQKLVCLVSVAVKLFLILLLLGFFGKMCVSAVQFWIGRNGRSVGRENVDSRKMLIDVLQADGGDVPSGIAYARGWVWSGKDDYLVVKFNVVEGSPAWSHLCRVLSTCEERAFPCLLEQEWKSVKTSDVLYQVRMKSCSAVLIKGKGAMRDLYVVPDSVQEYLNRKERQ